MRNCSAGSSRWSPDSSRLAFDCAGAGNFQIYVVSAGGGPARRLTTESWQNILPSWSHDGRWVYFCSNRSGNSDIWKARPQGGPAVQVTRSGGYDSFESPDGKLLYYSKQKTPGLWSVPVEGGPGTRVLDSVRHFWWAIADAGIYFVSSDNAQHLRTQTQLSFYSFETRKVIPAGTLKHDLDLDTPSLAVSRDGRRLLIVQHRSAIGGNPPSFARGKRRGGHSILLHRSGWLRAASCESCEVVAECGFGSAETAQDVGRCGSSCC